MLQKYFFNFSSLQTLGTSNLAAAMPRYGIYIFTSSFALSNASSLVVIFCSN
jgi:hypothetical protein